MANKLSVNFIIPGVIVLLLTACSGGSAGPAQTIESYNQALVEKDTNRAATLSCADWEPNAINEVESFAAVTVELENMQCSQSDEDGEIALVSCSGKIIANYGDEVLEIDLSTQTYEVIQQGGQWLMCGYR